MKLVHLDDIAWDEWSSPGGKFHGQGQQVSLALGAVADAPTGQGGHPFDVEHGRLRPGKSGCPFHCHSSQWELFIITRGEGTVRHGSSSTVVRAGDAVVHPPGPEAHQLINTGPEPLEYLLFADNPPVDVWYYPDSQKWGYRPAGGIFRKQFVDYHLGEEDGAAAEVAPRAHPEPLEHQRARFVTISAIAEQARLSPQSRYGSFVRDISIALGGIRDTGAWGGGHPFDVQQRRIPAGRAVCPYHAHTVQWELFIICEGTAIVRSAGETHEVRAGHAFVQPPGTPHQIRATGDSDLVFYVVADNPAADSCYYPDSDKWLIKPQGKCFRMTEVDYFDGEE